MSADITTQVKSKFEIKDYVRAFFRRKGLFMIGFMVVTPLVFPIIFGLPNVYRSKTVVLIRENKDLNILTGRVSVGTSMRERIKTFKSEILSWNNITRAMDAVGVSDLAETPLQMEQLVGSIKSNIRISTAGSTRLTDIINVMFFHRDPIITQRFLNVLVTNFIEKSLKEQRVEVVATINFIKEQVTRYEEKLKESESRLIGFKKEHMFDLPEQRGTSANSILNLEMRKTDLGFELESLNNEKNMLVEQLAGEEEQQERFIAPDDPILEESQNKLERLTTQLENLELIYTELHPDIIESKRLIEGTRAIIEKRQNEIKEEKIVIENPTVRDLETKISRIDLKIAIVEARKRQVERNLRQTREKLEQQPSLDEKYRYLLYENEAIKKVLNALKERLEATRMAQHIESSEQGVKFEVLEPARLPLKPFEPNRWKILLMGILAGLAIGGAIAFIVEFADHSFRGTEDARLNLPIPVVGVIPSIVTARERRKKRVKNFLFGCLSLVYIIGLGVVSAYVYKYYH